MAPEDRDEYQVIEASPPVLAWIPRKVNSEAEDSYASKLCQGL